MAAPSIGYAKVNLDYVRTGSAGATCAEPGEFLRIGSDYVGVSDESTDKGVTYGVQCQVKAAADGKFQVIARAEKRGSGNASLTLQGTVAPITGAQPGFKSTFQSTTAVYSQDNCTVELLDTASVSEGKIRGVLRCTEAAKADVPNNVRCAALAEFQFEECAKQ